MIKVFEAFSGYGSQRMSLKNTNIPYEVVGISEIDKDVLLSYAAIHEDLINIKEDSLNVSDEDIYKYLEARNIPLNYKTFKNEARKLKGQKLKDFYIANFVSKNFGDIRIINPHDIPDFDLFTYSFPCQDISVAGYQNGLSRSSGTRSSLLWDCCKIIEYKKPKYLLMENVKNLIGKNHIKDFNKFLNYLENLGYVNTWSVLNARDFGVPQNRERVFCVSVLNESFKFDLSFEKRILNTSVADYLEKEVNSKFFLDESQYTLNPIDQKYIYCLDSNYWKGTFLNDFLEKKRRQLVSGPKMENGMYSVRRLTPLETWRFMGCKDEDFYKAKAFVSNTSLYKQSGNSIVVPVLDEIFKKLFM